MDEWNDPHYWGLLNLGIAINTAFIAARLFIRAARDREYAGARILYGGMFTAVCAFFSILAISQWHYGEGRPEAGLVGLVFLWLATTAAVCYLLFCSLRRDDQ
jgi:hypothetical protein